MLWNISIIVAAMAAAFPVMANANDSELHTFHCLNGCHVGASATNDIIVREIYTVSSNDLTKMADWVAYGVTKESIGASGNREWRVDLNATDERSELVEHAAELVRAKNSFAM